MTLPQYRELAAYWRKFPPPHLLLTSLLVYKSSEKRTNDLGELLAGFGHGVGLGPR
jgi:hypothetical protein